MSYAEGGLTGFVLYRRREGGGVRMADLLPTAEAETYAAFQPILARQFKATDALAPGPAGS